MTDLVSVVIPVHNAAPTLGAQLEALTSQLGAPPYEVVVVLNRCTDNSRSVAEAFSDRLSLITLAADDLPSAAHARNAGAAVAKGDILAFCDADDVAEPHWIAGMDEALRSGCDVVGGKVSVMREGLPEWLYRARYERIDGRCVHFAQNGLAYVLGASMACTRTAFAAVDGFDERFLGAGAEEVDFTSRLQRHGFRVGVAPMAVMRYRPRTTFRGALQQVKGYARGNVMLAKKEGRLRSRPSQAEVGYRMLRRLAHHLVISRTWSPRSITLGLLTTYHEYSEIRLQSSDGSPSTESAECAVGPEVPVIGGLALQCMPRTRNWYAREGIERVTLSVLAKLLKEGNTFVDVGANIGTYTVAAALLMGGRGRVISFEPDLRPQAALRANIARHRLADLVEVRSEAVCDTQGFTEFVSHENDLVSGLAESVHDFHPGGVVQRGLVATTTLSAAITSSADIIKIDVEGFEPAVLRGAAELLERHPAILIVEVNPAALRNAGSSPEELLALLPPSRWKRWLVDEARRSAPSPLRELDADAEVFVRTAPRNWYGNIIAVPSHATGSVAELRELAAEHEASHTDRT